MLERTGVLFQINSEETNWNQLFKLNEKSMTGLLEHTCAMLDLILSTWTLPVIMLICRENIQIWGFKKYILVFIHLFILRKQVVTISYCLKMSDMSAKNVFLPSCIITKWKPSGMKNEAIAALPKMTVLRLAQRPWVPIRSHIKMPSFSSVTDCNGPGWFDPVLWVLFWWSMFKFI